MSDYWRMVASSFADSAEVLLYNVIFFYSGVNITEIKNVLFMTDTGNEATRVLF